MLHSSVLVILLFSETSPSSTLEYPGRKRTSSKVKLSSIRYFGIFPFIDGFNYEGCLKSHKRWTCNKSKYQTCLRVLYKRDSIIKDTYKFLYSLTTIRLGASFFGMTTFFIFVLAVSTRYVITQSKRSQMVLIIIFSVYLAILWRFFASRNFSSLHQQWKIIDTKNQLLHA